MVASNEDLRKLEERNSDRKRYRHIDIHIEIYGVHDSNTDCTKLGSEASMLGAENLVPWFQTLNLVCTGYCFSLMSTTAHEKCLPIVSPEYCTLCSIGSRENKISNIAFFINRTQA